MKIDSIASCCTAKILSYFQTGPAVGPEDMYPGRDIGRTKEDLLREMREHRLAKQCSLRLLMINRKMLTNC